MKHKLMIALTAGALIIGNVAIAAAGQHARSTCPGATPCGDNDKCQALGCDYCAPSIFGPYCASPF